MVAALERIAELQSALAPKPVEPPAPVARTASFAGQLQGALTGAPVHSAFAPPPLVGAGGTTAGRAALAAIQREVGVAEQPPGSNDSPRIAQYRQATVGAGVGPWCAYFVSWAAREAGAPLGAAGQGFGRVDDVWAWAQSAGKAIPAAGGQPPQPGDLVVWDEHIGIVEAVNPDGSVQTIEGNSSDAVTRRMHGPGADGAIGYVRLG